MAKAGSTSKNRSGRPVNGVSIGGASANTRDESVRLASVIENHQEVMAQLLPEGVKLHDLVEQLLASVARGKSMVVLGPVPISCHRGRVTYAREPGTILLDRFGIDEATGTYNGFILVKLLDGSILKISRAGSCKKRSWTSVPVADPDLATVPRIDLRTFFAEHRPDPEDLRQIALAQDSAAMWFFPELLDILNRKRKLRKTELEAILFGGRSVHVENRSHTEST